MTILLYPSGIKGVSDEAVTSAGTATSLSAHRAHVAMVVPLEGPEVP
jgi:hypothetical protein